MQGKVNGAGMGMNWQGWKAIKNFTRFCGVPGNVFIRTRPERGHIQERDESRCSGGRRLACDLNGMGVYDWADNGFGFGLRLEG